MQLIGQHAVKFLCLSLDWQQQGPPPAATPTAHVPNCPSCLQLLSGDMQSPDEFRQLYQLLGRYATSKL